MSTESTSQAPARPPTSSRPRLIPATEFDPSPELAEKLLSRLADPDFSLGSLAEIANTSLESFTLWLTKPDIAARIANIESAMATKVRLDVACYVPLIIHSCKTTLAFYAEALNHRHISDTDNRGHSIRARQGHTAMMASRILLHLAKHYARPQSPRPDPSGPNRNHNPNPNLPSSDPNSNTTNDTSRFDLLPRLADITNLHDQRAANHTTSPNPTRDNSTDSAFTSPSRERRSDASHAGDEAPRIPECETQSPPHLATTTPNTTTPASEAESLTCNSPGLSESASATPGKQPLDSPHPVRVQPATPGKSPCACHSKSRKNKSCGACASHTPTPILISAGTTTPRPREQPKPSV